jgi:putative membrane protein
VSNDLHRLRTTASAADDVIAAPVALPAPATTNRVPHTRTGAAWFGVCAAAFLFVVLIVFMVQNTRSVEVTFLWMHGSLPLALALLTAAVGAAIVAVVVGAARITQLRRLYRRQRH